MLINVDELKVCLDRLNQLISDYEELHLNMYNNLSSTFYCWNDVNSKKFLISNDNDKKNFSLLVGNYKNLYEVYYYIWEQYSKFGKTIYYELSNKDNVYSKFNNYISKLENVIYKYDVSRIINDRNFYYKINNERNRLKNELDKVRSIYSDVRNFYDSINDINIEVSEKLANIEIKDVQELIVNDYV